MKRPPQIEIAGNKDLVVLAQLAATTFVDTYAGFNTLEDIRDYVANHFSEERLAAELVEADSCFLLMRLEGDPVGYARMRKGFPGVNLGLGPSWEIERFYVVAAYHGKGLAPYLLEACCREAKRRGFAGLWLGVWNQNHRARRFYEKMGFRDRGEKIFMLGKDAQRDRVLVLPLSP